MKTLTQSESASPIALAKLVKKAAVGYEGAHLVPHAEAAWLPLRRVAGRPPTPPVENDDVGYRLGWLSPWVTVGSRQFSAHCTVHGAGLGGGH